jgi:translocator protein
MENTVVQLIISVIACFAAGGIGSFFTVKSVPTWYPGLKKPRYTPPGQVFGPVWTTLYLLMGISVFLVWQKGLSADGVLLTFVIFWVQLVFNALWSIVFFGLRSKGGGVIIIGILWVLILAAIITSFNVSWLAGTLLIPYILWVSIASYLNIGIWRLNQP